MTFWPLVFHILIFLFLKTKLHRDLLVEWTQHILCEIKLSPFMNWKDCIEKLPMKRKTDNLLWSEILSVQSTSCTLTSADSAIKLIDFLILKATAAKYLVWRPICHRGFPETFQQRLTTTPDLNQVPPSSHCLRHPQSQCFSRSRDLVVEVVVVVVIVELIKQKL